MCPEVETSVISATALKVEPVATVSDLAASQLTEVGIIPAFGGLVWFQHFRARAGISSGRHPIGIQTQLSFWTQDSMCPGSYVAELTNPKSSVEVKVNS